MVLLPLLYFIIFPYLFCFLTYLFEARSVSRSEVVRGDLHTDVAIPCPSVCPSHTVWCCVNEFCNFGRQAHALHGSLETPFSAYDRL